MFCRERAARFEAERDALEEAGVTLAFVGNGSPLMARDFQRNFGITATLFTDPGRRSYAALGLERSFGLWKSLGRGHRATKAGFRQGKIQGDAWQQGGVVLFDREGNVRWKHADSGAGDQADLSAFKAAVRALS